MHWLLGEGGLEPLEVFRASAPEEYMKAHNLADSTEVEGAIYIPFWTFSVDTHSIIQDIKKRIADINKSAGEIIKNSTSVDKEDDDQFSLKIDYRRKDERVISSSASILADAASSADIPPASEINFLLSKLSRSIRLNVFVPAFLSVNPYAYIKVGRLMTSYQPELSYRESNKSESPILCALTKSIAVDLVDFIFIATLPEKIQLAGKLIESIHLKTTGVPRLIEFPFILEGYYLTSLHGGFSVSRKLVSLEWQKETV